MAIINSVGNALQGTTGTGNFVGANTPTLITPILGVATATSIKFSGNNGLIDSNGNEILSLFPVASAVNYILLANNVTTQPPVIAASGSDASIAISIQPKGAAGNVSINTAAVGNPAFSIISGTTSRHTTQFNFIDTAQTRTVTFPDATGTVQLQSQALITAPANSASSSLSVGSAFQNTAGYDVMLTVYLSITAATTASILLGVGTTNTPTQQTIISSISTAALSIVAIPIYIPNNYYALLSTSGTITQTISGQMSMAI